jgi:hypothetical protein
VSDERLASPWYDIGAPERADGMPAAFPAVHPDAVGTRAERWATWVEDQVGPLRWWQKLVMARALEVDAAGEFVWRRVLVTTPRQVGKSVLLSALALARIHAAEELGEEQLVLHLSMNLMNAGSVMGRHWPWAHERGYRVTRSKEQQAITLPTGDQWRIVAAKSAFGFSAGCVLVDEAWELSRQEITSGVIPTMAARSHAQLWMFSTANNLCTDYVPGLLRGSDPSAAVMGWWAPRDSDPQDWEALRAASPYHDERRAVAVRLMWDSAPELRSEFLNIWPDVFADAGRWLSLVDWQAARADRLPAPAGPVVGAVEVNRTGERVTWMRGHLDAQGRLVVRGGAAGSVDRALQDMGAVESMVAGASLRPMLEVEVPVQSYGVAQTMAWSGVFAEAVRRRQVVHDGDPWLLGQVAVARAEARGEQGAVLAPRRTPGDDVTGVKLCIWLHHRLRRRDVDRPQPAAAIW